MPNKVEIEVTSTDKTKAGFASARAAAMAAGKDSGNAFDKAFLASTRGTGERVSKQIEAGISRSSQSAGSKAGNSFRKGLDTALNKTIPKAFENAVEYGAKGVAGALIATGGSAGIAFGAAVVGGLSVALTAGGVVGLAGFLLKDNEKVKEAWGKTFEGITTDAQRRAGFLEDEFVAGAGRVAVAWETSLGPALERIFIKAQPLVDDFIEMPISWMEKLAPGIETAVGNAGPAVEGLKNMGDSIFKGFGDGLAELSTHSESIKVAFELAGAGAGKAIEGIMGWIGKAADMVANNKAEFEKWGQAIGDAADWGGKKLLALGDAFAALSHGVGSSEFKEAVKKMVEGEDYKPPQQRQQDADYKYTKTKYEQAAPMVRSAQQAGTGESEDQILKGLGLFSKPELIDMNTDRIRSLGMAVDSYNRYLAAGVPIGEAQANVQGLMEEKQRELVQSTQLLSMTQTGAVDATRLQIGAFAEVASSGMAVESSLMGVVSGLTAAQIQASGASVKFDELGNAIVSVPGQKDVVISADTLAANNGVREVVNSIAAVQSKTVTVTTNIVTNYSTTGVSGTGMLGPNGSMAVRNKGGWIPGGGPDRDSVSAMLTPGEFVVNRKAAKRNAGLLEAMNVAAGGDVDMEAMTSGSSGGSGGGYSGGGGGHLTIGFDTSGFDSRAALSWLINLLRINGKKVPDLTSAKVA